MLCQKYNEPTAWRSEGADISFRNRMLQSILEALCIMKRTASLDQGTKDNIAMELERSLYDSASSRASYEDRNTLKRRMIRCMGMRQDNYLKNRIQKLCESRGMPQNMKQEVGRRTGDIDSEFSSVALEHLQHCKKLGCNICRSLRQLGVCESLSDSRKRGAEGRLCPAAKKPRCSSRETFLRHPLSMLTNFTQGQIEQHLNALQQEFSAPPSPQGHSENSMQRSVETCQSGSVCAVCNGNDLEFQMPVYRCNGTCGKNIRRKAYYFADVRHKFTFCNSCFKALPDEITISKHTISKSKFIKTRHVKNNDWKEGWVCCDTCNKWVHQVCGLFNPNLEKRGRATEFHCPACLLQKMAAKNLGKQDRLRSKMLKSAAELDRSGMTDYIEGFLFRRMEELQGKDAESAGCGVETRAALPQIFVRTALNRDEPVAVQQEMLRRYKKHNCPHEFSYSSKCILLFQRIDGADVLLFVMYAHEFDERCEGPNQRSVYISYVDSVKYFQPSRWRTAIWQEIITAYLSYARERGFVYGFLWACPPLKNDNYILHCKPRDQKTPKAARLREWYRAMLSRAERKGLVYNADTLWNQYFGTKVDPIQQSRGEEGSGTQAGRRVSKKKENNFVRKDACATRLPYYSGDCWNGMAEDLIKKISRDEEQKQRRAEIQAKRASKGNHRPTRCKTRTQAGSVPDEDSSYGVHEPGTPDALMCKLATAMGQMKDDFIVVQLTPRCWCCEQYILSVDRYACKRSREWGDKNYVLCQDCFDVIPQENKAVVSTVELVNSVTTSVDRRTLLGNNGAGSSDGTSGGNVVAVRSEEAKEKELSNFKKTFGDHTFHGCREFIRERLPKMIPNPSNDPNPKRESEMFATRSNFLSMCQRNFYQYDQLRRAKHTSMMVVHHLHYPEEYASSQGRDSCSKTGESGHRPKPSQPRRRLKLTKDQWKALLYLLSHASKCVDGNCVVKHCKGMKKMLIQEKVCEVKGSCECGNCENVKEWKRRLLILQSCRSLRKKNAQG